MNVRRPFGLPDVPVPTGSESASFDRRAIDDLGVPQPVLMENAGRAAARLTEHLFPEGDVLAVVGGGNNGGDALVALRTLAAWGRTVHVVKVADREGGTLLHGWPLEEVADGELGDGDWSDLFARSGVVVDGILGTGIRGAPRERQAAAIERVNAFPGPVLSLDIPSGVDADTGDVPGTVVRADVTVAFGFPKLGALLHPGRAHAGRLVAVEIGFPPPDLPFTGRLVTPGWASARRPSRGLDTHKTRVGSLLVVAGTRGMAGAAVLTTRAALRTGVGLVRVASPAVNRGVIQGAAPEAIFVDADDREELRAAVERSDAVVAGPGLGREDASGSLLSALLRTVGERPLLLDADALNLIAAGRPSLNEALADRPVILTPHPGEMGRLLGRATTEVVADRPGVAREFAEEHQCALLLKGTPSVVAAPGHPLLVDTVGSSALATGGMGDVLSGVVGALLARGLAPREAGGVGLFLSGRAAARAGGREGLLPTDVVRHLPGALGEEGPGDTDLPRGGLVFDQDPPG